MDVHRGVPRNLDEVLSWEEERVVQRDWTVACEGKRYQLDRQHEALSLVRRKVIVRTLRNGRVQLVYRGKQLKWRSLPVGAAEDSAAAKAKQPKPVKTKTVQAARGEPSVAAGWSGSGAEVLAAGSRRRGRAARLAVRDSGRPPLRSGLPASRTASRGKQTTKNNQQRGHSLVS